MLEGKALGKHASVFDDLRLEIDMKLTREMRYPNQDRPFEEKVVIPSDFNKYKQKYFSNYSIRLWYSKRKMQLMNDSRKY